MTNRYQKQDRWGHTCYDRAIRNVAPATDAIRLGPRHGGHTGGAWLIDGEVWKPCDGGNIWEGDHYPTDEVKTLTALAGCDLIPNNWRIEERNDRQFIVRRKGILIPEEEDLSETEALYVEQAVQMINAKSYEINDPIGLAKDPVTGELYIYDLSIAQRHSAADDRDHVRDFFQRTGHQRLYNLRHMGIVRHVDTIHYLVEHKLPIVLMSFVYATNQTVNQPCDTSAWRLPSTSWYAFNIDEPDPANGRPCTMIVSVDPLPAAVRLQYDLEIAFQPAGSSQQWEKRKR